MATQLCQKCKQAHPGRVCDYDDKGDCAETIAVNDVDQPADAPPKAEVGIGSDPRSAEPEHQVSLPPQRCSNRFQQV